MSRVKESDLLLRATRLMERVASLLYVGAVSVRVTELSSLALYGTTNGLISPAMHAVTDFPASLRVRIQSIKGRLNSDTTTAPVTYRLLDPITSTILYLYMVVVTVGQAALLYSPPRALTETLEGVALFPSFQQRQTLRAPQVRSSVSTPGDRPGIAGQNDPPGAARMRRFVPQRLFAQEDEVLQDMPTRSMRQVVAHLLSIVMIHYPKLRVPAIRLVHCTDGPFPHNPLREVRRGNACGREGYVYLVQSGRGGKA